MGLEQQLKVPVESCDAGGITCLAAAVPRVTGELFHKSAASEEQRVTDTQRVTFRRGSKGSEHKELFFPFAFLPSPLSKLFQDQLPLQNALNFQQVARMEAFTAMIPVSGYFQSK